MRWRRVAIALAIALGTAAEVGAFLEVGEGAKWDNYMASYGESP